MTNGEDADMNRPSRIIVLAAVLLMSACQRSTLQSTSSATPEPTQLSREELAAEELAVYSVLLKEGFSRSVFLDETWPDADRYPDWLLDVMPLLTRETLDAYTAANEQLHTLTLPADSNEAYETVSYEELIELLDWDYESEWEKWDRFCQRYPDASGYASFSRVGFNARIDQALVYTASHSDIDYGTGNYYLFLKQDGEWQTVDEQTAWLE